MVHTDTNNNNDTNTTTPNNTDNNDDDNNDYHSDNTIPTSLESGPLEIPYETSISHCVEEGQGETLYFLPKLRQREEELELLKVDMRQQ